MCNVRMIRTEPGLVSIPLEKAVYCENCTMVSSSARQRCGLCGSERIAFRDWNETLSKTKRRRRYLKTATIFGARCAWWPQRGPKRCA